MGVNGRKAGYQVSEAVLDGSDHRSKRSSFLNSVGLSTKPGENANTSVRNPKDDRFWVEAAIRISSRWVSDALLVIGRHRISKVSRYFMMIR